MKLAAILPLLLLLPMSGDEPVVAHAKGQDFTRAQYGEWLVQRVGVQYLTDYLFAELVVRMAAERGLAPTEAELEAAYEEEYQRTIDNGKSGDLNSYTADLALRGYSLETWKQKRFTELRSELSQFRLALADRQITDEWLASRYKDLFGALGERVNVEVYYFGAYRGLDPTNPNPDVTALKAAAHERAVAAIAQLKSGVDRATVMGTTDPVSSTFVTDGIITGYRRQMLGTEVERAVASLDEPGDTSLPVDVFDGTYVLRLVVREPVRMQDVRDELVAAIMSEAVSGSELAAVRASVFDEYAVEPILR